jgi:Sec-independent protein translocase protein TatA
LELSFTEILAVVAIALIAFGPEDLVRYSRKLGVWVGKAKTEMNNFRVLTEEALLNNAAKKEIDHLQKQINSPLDLEISLEKVNSSKTESQIEESLIKMNNDSRDKKGKS